MGTRFEVVIARADAPRDRWMAMAEAALGVVAEWHGRLNRFDRSSLVSWIATRPQGEPIEIDADMGALLALCDDAFRASGGAFDAARGRWAELTLERDAGTLTPGPSGALLDFGGVAKGFALDLAADELRSLGARSALLHGGTSTVVAIGSAPDGPWTARVVDDGPVVELDDLALSVSRNDRLAPRPGHVLDHRGGGHARARPVAAVLGPRAAPTDAWSTALLVADPPGSLEARLTTILPLEGGGWRVEGPDASRMRDPGVQPESR